MQGLLGREPVAVFNAITNVIETGIVLGVAFGLQLSSYQIGAIMAFVVALSSALRVIILRSRVTPLADPRDEQGRELRPVPADMSRPPAAGLPA